MGILRIRIRIPNTHDTLTKDDSTGTYFLEMGHSDPRNPNPDHDLHIDSRPHFLKKKKVSRTCPSTSRIRNQQFRIHQ